MGNASGMVGEEKSFSQKYRLGAKLGNGSSAQVREAKQQDSGISFAVKIIDVRARRVGKSPCPDTVVVDQMRLDQATHELDIMRCVGGHENCVQLYDVFLDSVISCGLVYLVMEKCQCSVKDGLGELALASEAYVARIFREMLLGLQHVHAAGIVHRDVKPDNFLFGAEPGSAVKLTDFGLSAKLPPSGCLTGRFGTLPYMSPEMLDDVPYSEATDMWSFGAAAYVLLYIDTPYFPAKYLRQDCWVDAQAIRNNIVVGEPAPSYAPPAYSNVPLPSDRAELFVRTMLERVQNSRCTAAEALQLPFLNHADSYVSSDEDSYAIDEWLARHETCKIRPNIYTAAMSRDCSVDSVPSIFGPFATDTMPEEASCPPIPVRTWLPSWTFRANRTSKCLADLGCSSQSTACSAEDYLCESASATCSEYRNLDYL